MKLRTTSAAILTGVSLLAPLGAKAETPADGWQFSVMPYLWLPGVSGKLNYGPPPRGGGTANVSVDAATLLDNLDLAFMIAGEARKDRWLVATDIIYLDFSHADSTVRSVDLNPGTGPIRIDTVGLNASTDSSLTGWLWTLAGGYAAVQDPKASLDAIAGFRLLSLKTSTNWNLNASLTANGPLGATATFGRSGSVEKSDNLWAGIVGAKGRIKLGEGPWFANYYADIGGASSLFTWQGAAGVGYGFKWGDVILDYRYLYYSQSGNDKLIDNLSFGGFGLAANFRF